MSDLICFLVQDFEGHYPVGTAAIVYATDREHCKSVLLPELFKLGLGRGKPDEWTISPLTPVPTTPRAVVVADGNY
jgi:hypothetical protein